MNIQEMAKEVQILPETFNAIEKVKMLTGKDMIFKFEEGLLSHALLKTARKFMPEHIVYINKEKAKNINHVIVHECYHIYRFYEVDEQKRFVLATKDEESKKRIEIWKKELGSKGNQYPDAIFNSWNKGLTSLFYNAVTDTRIELAMYKDYPGLIEEQNRSLKQMESEIKATLDKKVQKIVAPSVYLQSGAMNYVFLTQLTPIIGKAWKKHFKGHTDITNLGNKLLKVIPKEDEGLSQDIEILNKWSKILDFHGVQWNSFEEVPLNYAFVY